MDTKAQSTKALCDHNHAHDTGAEEWTDDLAILDAWTSSLVSVRGRSQATARRYRGLVERLLKDVAQPIAQLDQRLIEKHLRRLHVAGRGESVRRGVVVAIRSLGEWCLAHGIIESNPGASLSGPRPYRREIKVLTVAEVERLLWGDSPGTLPRDPVEMRNRVLLGVTYVAGLRASEIGPLEAEGVVWHETGQIFSILVRRGKGSGQDVRLPLDRPVSRMLGAWLAVRGSGNGGGAVSVGTASDPRERCATSFSVVVRRWGSRRRAGGFRRTSYATASPPTCCRRAWTSARSSSFCGTGRSRRRSSICMRMWTGWGRC